MQALRLLPEPDPRGRLRLIEYDVLALQEDVSKDRKRKTRVHLDAAIARCAGSVRRCVVDVRARNSVQLAADDERERRQCGGAGKDVAAVCCAVGGTGHSGVVGADNGAGQIEQRGAGVGDAVDAGGGSGAADGVAAGGEFPEAAGGADCGVVKGAGVCGCIDVLLGLAPDMVMR